jgi:putative salt-induced outer membrane protein YdiY
MPLKNTHLSLLALLLMMPLINTSYAAQEVVLGDYIQTDETPKTDDPTELGTPSQSTEAVTQKSADQEITLADVPDSDEDWVWLQSGEFLIGTIEDLYDETLTFDSDDLGDLKIGWDDISRIHSRQLFTVRTVYNEIITGTVTLDNGILTITNNRQHKVPQEDLLTLIAGLENGVNIWDGKVTFGANLSAGNTEKLEYNAKAEVSRHTTTSRIKAEYTANIGQTNNIQTDDNQRFILTYDVYSDKKMFFRPVDLTLFRDPFQNVGYRINLGLGLGYQLIDEKEQELEVNVGPSYLYTQYEYADDLLNSSDSSLALSLTTTYEREIHDKIDLDLSYKITATESSVGGYLQNTTLNFDIELTDILDFDVTFNWDRVNNPLNDSSGNPLEKNDFRVSFGLGVSFN